MNHKTRNSLSKKKTPKKKANEKQKIEIQYEFDISVLISRPWLHQIKNLSKRQKHTKCTEIYGQQLEYNTVKFIQTFLCIVSYIC